MNRLRQEREKGHACVYGSCTRPSLRSTARSAGSTELEMLNGQVRDLPTTQQELLGLIRDVEVSTGLYTSLLTTAQELARREGWHGRQRAGHRLRRHANTSPVKPSKSQIILISTAAGRLRRRRRPRLRKALQAGVDDPDLIEKAGQSSCLRDDLAQQETARMHRDLKAKQASKRNTRRRRAERSRDREPEEPQDGAAFRHDGRQEQLHHDRRAQPGGRQVVRQRQPGGRPDQQRQESPADRRRPCAAATSTSISAFPARERSVRIHQRPDPDRRCAARNVGARPHADSRRVRFRRTRRSCCCISDSTTASAC